jgi:hypothetical protein
MSKIVCQQLSSLEIIPSAITLREYDGFPLQPKGLYQTFPIKLGGVGHIFIDFNSHDKLL